MFIFPSRELVGPGGFLDSQTTDTQFFGDSQSLQGHWGNDITFDINDNDLTFVPRDDDSSESCNSESEPVATGFVPPASNAMQDEPSTLREPSFSLKASESAPEVQEAEPSSKKAVAPIAAIQYTHQRDGTNGLAWTKLDAFINGPNWDPKIRVWMNLPIVRKHHPAILQVLQDSVWHHRCEEEEDLMFGLQKAVQQLYLPTLNRAPANVLQAEFIRLAEFLPQVYPGMVNAAHRSDLLRMQELINVGRQFLDGLQILVDTEKSAREAVNREVVI
jgi:hypothetical protein